MPLTREEAALLLRGPLFRNVDKALLFRLAEEEGASRVRFEPGVVYSPQDFRRSLAVVLDGQLRVTKGALAVSVLKAGDLLVDRLLAEQSQIRENYLRYLTGRIRFLSGRLQTLSQPGAEGKLARYLLSGSGSSCPATELCRRLGVSRASLYRAFSALEDSGLIVRKGKSITIIDPAGLETVL